MFTESAAYYGRLYQFKDYEAEYVRLRQIAAEYLPIQSAPPQTYRLLDAACGTGKHLALLARDFRVEGLDLDPRLLEVARARLPGIPLHHADMQDFHLGRTYDVITCLFSSIAYLLTLEAVTSAFDCMAEHLNPGGLLLVEPWFTPEQWRPGRIDALTVDDPQLKITRMNTTGVEGRISTIDFHYMVGTPQGVRYFTEHHALGLLELAEMEAALTHSGLRVRYDSQGLTGRGLWIALKPGATD